VADRFGRLLSNLRLSDLQVKDGVTKTEGVRSALNRHYYNSASSTANSFFVGSWGKGTAIRPPRDIDLMFVLPYEVYQRFEERVWNRQSQLLQEVKEVLSRTYSTTDMRGDGQVIMVGFGSYAVEVVPAFKLTDGKYWICNTKDGGSYKTTDPFAEIGSIEYSDRFSNGNARDLIRMNKRWQEYRAVPLKSFCLEILSTSFIETWEYRGKSSFFYDWMIRDFFGFLLTKKNSFIYVPGTSEPIYLGSQWESKVQSAHQRAVKACEFEGKKFTYLAGDEWQKIFGDFIPVS